MTSCQYETEYFENSNVKHFKCERDALDNKGACLFHDRSFLQDKNHPENVQKSDLFTCFIRDKISDPASDRIECIGYHLPNITIHEKFTKTVLFIECKFQETDFSKSLFLAKAYFSKSLFLAKVNFSGSDFIDYAVFFGSRFSMDADFSEVTFNNKLTFYESEFHKALFNRTKFSEVILKRSIFIDYAVFFGFRFSMDADFSEVTFGKGLDFSRSRFSCEADSIEIDSPRRHFSPESTFLKDMRYSTDCNFA